MTDEPKRWLDSDAPPDVAELLRSARAPQPIPRAAFERSRRRLAAFGAAAGTTTFLSLKANALAAALGAATGLAVFGGALVLQSSEDPAPPAPAISAPAPAPAPSSGPLAAPPAAIAPLPPVSAAPATTGVRQRPAPDAATDSLAAELELLRRARASADPERGLALIDEHARRFPKGMLGIERELSAIELLERAGRRSEARSRAEALAGRVRQTPYSERVEHLLRRLR